MKAIMKRNYKILSLVLLLAFASCSFTSKPTDNLDTDDRLKQIMQVVIYVLEEGHFDAIPIDDKFSERLFDNYIERVDPMKRYFYQSDYKEFERYKTKLDDELKGHRISFFKLVHERMLQRLDEAKEMYRFVLSVPFDYSFDETFDTDFDKSSFVRNKSQKVERWRKQLKFSTLSNYDEILEQEKRTKERDPSHVMKTKTEIEKEAREATLKSLDIYFNDNVDDLTREEWFTIYINTIVEEFDPHTYYLAPKDKEGFDTQMSGKLEGIGARLTKRMDHIKIVELISGGPAWRSGLLEVEDIILKVKQEDEERGIDIVGMRINDAIKYIKGPKGTKVTLTIKKVDGTIEDVTITRDVVELVETYAKSSVIEKDNKKFGIINLPRFYVDFKDYKNLNAAKDVKKEIERLKAEGMEGLILDLRNNGGGSLPAVVDMAGLFIKEGPVVQVRSTEDSKEVLKDRDKSITWDGPLVILVNELSASASEIMAAAMQDYKRAIVIGSNQTYGKGTVQNVYNLNSLLRSTSHGDLGALAFTTQKYYRINGGSVQLEGVKSDVKVPGRFSFIDVGEKEKENPLPYDEIDPAKYQVWDNYFDYDQAISRSNKRMNKNSQLKLIEENARWVKNKIDETEFSLNYETYKQQIEKNENEAKRFDAISDYKNNLTFLPTSHEKQLFKSDTTNLQEKRERWYETLSSDVYVEEAVSVLEDLKFAYSIKKVAKVKD
ncbi:carboxy terminal-processing peptidase [Flavobacteriaceae bacterium MHTCC 0001]